jgi:hypothetical protein
MTPDRSEHVVPMRRVRLSVLKNDLAERWVDIERNDEVFASHEPRSKFPVCCYPMYDRSINIGIIAPAPDSHLGDSPMVDRKVHSNVQPFSVCTLSLKEHFPLLLCQLRKRHLADWHATRYETATRRPKRSKRRNGGKR